jgi:predicted acylesterase/phospholipase RssA
MTHESESENSSARRHEPFDNTLLTRFLVFEPLSGEELGQLSNQLFGIVEDLTEKIDAVLSEPPDPVSVVAPQVLFGVLTAQRQLLDAQSHLSDAEIALADEVRERMAICVCADDALPRETRLLKALILLTETRTESGLSRRVTQRWIAAIVLRLVDEFNFQEYEGFNTWNTFACQAIQNVASKVPHPKVRFGMFCDFCRLKLLELTSEKLAGDDGEQKKSAWTDDVLHAAQSFFPAAAKEDDDLGAQFDFEFELNTYDALRLTMVGDDVNAAQRTLHLANQTSFFLGNASIAIELSKLLLDAMVIAVRNRTMCNWPVQDAVELLLPVSKARHKLVLQDERTRENLHRQILGEDIAEIVREQSIDIPIDEAALRRHVERQLDSESGRRHGLALSGGGFRATCFHIGVLAHLAETNDLGRLEAISCVSGGSIAGAAYAVRLKALLASKFDVDIGRGDFIEVVKDVIETVTLFAGSNLRMRALASPKAILKMWLHPEYTYTERIAELLDKMLFLPLALKHPSFAKVSKRYLLDQVQGNEAMTKPGSMGRFAAALDNAPIGWPLAPWDLRERPRGESLDFNTDRKYNASRSAKCPQVVFNATSINSGASFVFTPHAQGERPTPYAQQFSSRPRIPWTSYEDIGARALSSPERLKLSRIVAASASVPGLIPPVLLRRAQEDALNVLADGGIFDNQGVHYLIETRCDDIFVSDASGQLRYEAYPDSSSFSMMARANDIMMERTRELGYKDLLDSLANNPAMSMAHVHLTKDLSEAPPVSTFRPDNAFRRNLIHILDKAQTSFGVVRSYQRAMAGLRTDLDCFCKLEAYSLMLDGYLQAREARPSGPPEPGETAPSPEWPFMAVEQALKTDAPSARLTAILELGSNRFLRLPRLLWRMAMATPVGRIPGLRIGLVGAGLALIATALIMLARSIGPAVSGPLLVALVTGLVVLQMQASAFKRMLTKFLSGPLLLVAMFYAWFALLVGDPLYRRLGETQGKNEGT